VITDTLQVVDEHFTSSVEQARAPSMNSFDGSRPTESYKY